jgi:predicted RNase H-like HicB family nuclease
MKSKVEKIMSKPYNVVINPIKDGTGLYYYGKVLEFDGCQSTGATYDEAYNNLQEAMHGWIEKKLQAGYSIPKPFERRRV